MPKISFAIRPLTESDFERVMELDRINSGSSRRGFFEKRSRAMLENPEVFIGLAACTEERLVGFVMASILDGEFGGDQRVAVLDALGVAPDHRGQGAGRRLLGQLVSEVRRCGGHELQTQAQWNQPGLMDFFSSMGFTLAPRLVLERTTKEILF